MSKHVSLRDRRAAALADAAGWMEILRLDQKGFEILSEKVNLKVDPCYPIPDPVLRLISILRFLVTGEGYNQDTAEMIIASCCDICEVFQKMFGWPDSKTKWESIADGFQTKWQVPNCLGALVLQRLKVSANPEFDYLYETSCGDREISLFAAVDANYRIFVAGLNFHGIIADDQMINSIQPSGLPSPKTPSGKSGPKVPFAFLGSDTFETRPWLRVLSTGTQTEAETREIRQGLRPGELTLEILSCRFGLLRSTLPGVRPLFLGHLILSISCLHNYFLAENPKYAAEYSDVDQMRDNLSPPNEGVKESSFRVIIPGRTLDEDKAWMDQLHMDREAFQCLLQLARPHIEDCGLGMDPTLALRVALRYLSTGLGYDAMMDPMLKDTLASIFSALQSYDKKFPLTKEKWLEIATSFDREMGLPNCAGVLCSRLLDKDCPFKKNLLVMIVDPTGRISGSGRVCQERLHSTLMYLQEVFMQTTAFRLPQLQGNKRLRFIGDSLSKPCTMLATLASPGHFTREQMERGQKLGNQVIQVFKERFQVLNSADEATNMNRVGAMNRRCDESSHSRSAASLVMCMMHNFLMEKSATYGDVFKGLDN